MEPKTARLASAASGFALAGAIWLAYVLHFPTPFGDELLHPKLRPFLTSFGPLAAYGIFTAAIASERISNRLARVPAGIMAVVVSAYFLWSALQTMSAGMAGGLAVVVGFLPGISLAIAAFVMLSGVNGQFWRKIWLYLIALLILTVPPLVFSVRFGAIIFSLGDKYLTLLLALLPTAAFTLGLLIHIGMRPPVMLLSFGFGAVAILYLLALIGSLGLGISALPIPAALTLVMAAGCWFNWRAFRILTA